MLQACTWMGPLVIISFCMLVAPRMAAADVAFTLDPAHPSKSTHLFGQAGAVPLPAEYGKQLSVTTPVSVRYDHAEESRPPLQPMSLVSQETRSSGESTGVDRPALIDARSVSTSVAEKAQQLQGVGAQVNSDESRIVAGSLEETSAHLPQRC